MFRPELFRTARASGSMPSRPVARCRPANPEGIRHARGRPDRSTPISFSPRPVSPRALLVRAILPLDLDFVLGYNQLNSDQSDSSREPLSGRRDESWPGSRAPAIAEFDAVRQTGLPYPRVRRGATESKQG